MGGSNGIVVGAIGANRSHGNKIQRSGCSRSYGSKLSKPGIEARGEGNN